MPVLLKPFTGLVPASQFGHRVVGPPASMLSGEQRAAARLDPYSFRYSVGRGAGAKKAAARAWLDECEEQRVLQRVGPAVFVYRQTDSAGSVTGLIADVSLDAYSSGHVKRHEKTVSKTRRKMKKYIASTRIYGNPVALAHRPDRAIDAVIASNVDRPADSSFATGDGLSHELWVVEGAEAVDLCRSVDTYLYITDGHHRLAAAAAVAEKEGRPEACFPAGLFSTDQLRLRSFARCVVDPALDAGTVIDRLQSEHRMKEVKEPKARPRRRHEFGVKIRGHYFRLRLGGQLPEDATLDVDLLQDRILGPVFGISDPGSDGRLRFVADIPDRKGPVGDVDAWLLPFPVEVEDVMAIADAGRVMPPKSTWFAPKMPSGLVIRALD